MKNKKGYTLTEVLISFLLIMIVIVYLLRTVVAISNKNSELLTYQDFSVYENNLLNTIYKDIEVVYDDENFLGLEATSNTILLRDINKEIKLNKTNNTITYGNVIYALPDDVKFREENGSIYEISRLNNLHDYYVITIKLKVREKDEDLKIVYQNKYANNVLITFDSNGGTPARITINRKYGQTLGNLPTATKKGNSINGWYTAKTGGTKISPTTVPTKDVTYYAHWSPKTYTVKFDCNGGTKPSGKLGDMTVTYDQNYTIPSDVCTIAGYNQKNWKDSTNVTWTSGATGKWTFDDGQYGITNQVLTLNAFWDAKEYTITLNPNGGTYNGKTTNSTLTAKYNSIVNIGYPTRAGYTFTGWKTSDGKINDKNLLNNSPAANFSSPSTHASGGWRTASAAGGTRTSINITNPPIEGITKGFEIKADGSIKSLDIAQDEVPVTTGQKYTISVWAKGTGTLYLQAGNSTYKGQSFTLNNVSNWTRYYWTFTAGLDGSSNGNKTNIYFGNHAANGTIQICGMKLEDSDGFSKQLWTNISTSTTLIAQWTANTNTPYVVKHYTHNIGNANYTLNSTENKTGTTAASLTIANLKKTISGYTYENGFDSDKGTTKPSSGAVTTTTILANGTRVISLYYRPNYLYVQYDMNGGSLGTSGTGYTSSGTLVAYNSNTKFLRGVYGSKVGGVTTSTYAVDTSGLHNYNNSGAINIVKAGYTAKSGAQWNSKADGTGTGYNHDGADYNANGFAGADLTTGDKTVTIYVNWAKNPYTVTCEDYFVNASNSRITKLGSSTKTYEYGSTANGADWGSTTTKSAYYTNYVYKSATTGTVPANNNLVVYRYFHLWTDINIYYADRTTQGGATVSFSNNGSTWSDITNEVTADVTKPSGTTYYIKNIRPKNATEEFDSVTNLTWDSTNNYYKATPTTSGQSMNIYMKYKTFNVTLDKQGGTGGTDTIYQKYNTGYYTNAAATTQMSTSANGISTPTKQGYAFGGYYTDKNGEGTQYIDANGKLTSSASKTNFSANGTLYAKWTANKVYVQFHMNGGIWGGSTNTALSHDGEYVTVNGSKTVATYSYGQTGIDLPDYNNAGYLNAVRYGYVAKTNAHWNTKADGTGKSFNNSTASSNANDMCDASNGNCTATLYVNWTEKTYTLTVKPNGGTFDSKTTDSSYTLKYSDVKNLANPTRTGHAFNGWKELGAAGYTNGLSSVSVYKWSGDVSVASQSKSSDNLISAMTNEIKITNSGSSSSSPGLGGFVHSQNTAANKVYVHVFVAKLPAGYYFHNANNSIGTGGTTKWLTTNEGNGSWRTYAYQVNAGTSGTFSNFGHVYVSKDKYNNWSVHTAETGSYTAYLAYSNIYDITSDNTGIGQYDGSGVLTAQWQASPYTVTCEDYFVDASNNRKVKLGSSTKTYSYGTTANGADWGTDATKSKYYSNYVYKSATTGTVPANNNLVVYRYFHAWTDLNVYYADRTTQGGATVSFSVGGSTWNDVTNESNTVQPWGTTYYVKNIRPKNATEEFDSVTNLTWDSTNSRYYYTPTAAGTSMNIYMKYKIYNITLDKQSGTGGTNTIYEKYNTGFYTNAAATTQMTTSANPITAPTRSGYTFGGYYTSTSCGGTKYIAADGKLTSSASTTHFSTNGTLYACWTANSYTIEYYQGNNNATTAGTTKLTSSSHTYNTAKNLTAYSGTAPSGWTFYGWSTTQDGTSRTYTNSQSVNNLTSTANGVVKLYAVFSKTINVYSGLNKATNNSRTQYYNPYQTTKVTAISLAVPAAITNWTALGYRTDTTASTAATAVTTAAVNVTPAYNTTPTYYAVYSRSYTAHFYSGQNKGTDKTKTSNTAYFNSNAASAPTTVAVVTMAATDSADISNWSERGWRDDTTTGDREYTYGATATVAFGTNFYSAYSRSYTAHFYSGQNKGTDKTKASNTAYFNSNTATVPTTVAVVTMAATDSADISNWSERGWRDDTTTGDREYTYGATATVAFGTNFYSAYSRSYTAHFYSGQNKGTDKTKTSNTAYFNSNTATVPTTVAVETMAATDSADISNWSERGWRDDTTTGDREYTYGATATVAFGTNFYSVYSRSATAHFYSGVSKATTKTLTPTVYFNANTASVPTTTTFTLAAAGDSANISNWSELGWRDDTTAGAKEYDYGKTGVSITLGGTANYYSVYSRTLTITYAGNGATGGSTSNTTKTVYLNANSTTTSDQSVTLASNGFTKTGHTFSKWDKGNAGASYNPSVAYNAATFGSTATAQWTVNKYAFDLNGLLDGTATGNISGYGTADVYIGGTRVADDATDYYADQPYGTSYEIKDIKATAGHTYQGVSAGSLTGTIPASNSSVQLKFKSNSYSVKFNANGGSGSMSNESFTYGTAKALTSNSFTRTGYAFTGWSTSASDKIVSYSTGEYASGAVSAQTDFKEWVINGTYNGGDIYQLEVDVKGSGTLTNYFHQGLNVSKVEWTTSTGATGSNTNADGNNRIPLSSSYTHYTVRFTLASGTSSVAKHLLFRASAGSNVTIKNACLYKVTSSSKAYANSQSVKNLTTTDGATVNLYAIWKPITYYVKYNDNGADDGTMSNTTHTYDTARTLSATSFTKIGYSFIGWSTSASDKGLLYDTTEYSGSAASSASTYTNIKQFEIPGTFSSGEIYELNVDVKGSGTLTNYFYNGLGVASLVQTRPDGTTASNTHADGSNGMTLTSSYQHYKVRFTMTTGTNTNGKSLLFRVQPGNSATFKNVTLIKVSSSSKSFTNAESVKNLSSTSGATVNLYAIWKAKKIHITLNANGGTIGTREFWYYYNTAKYYSNEACTTQITSISRPSRSSYSFDGYYGDGTSGGDNPERYVRDDGTFADDLHYDVYKDATLTAQWTYVGSGGSSGGGGSGSNCTVGQWSNSGGYYEYTVSSKTDPCNATVNQGYSNGYLSVRCVGTGAAAYRSTTDYRWKCKCQRQVRSITCR